MRVIDYKISFIRLIATMLVVCLHILQKLSYTNESFEIISDFFNIGLVMFFCISAFLYSNKTIKDSRKWFLKRVKELIIPTLLSVILGMMIYYYWEKTVPFSKLFDSLLCGLGLEILSRDSWIFFQLWFMSYILFCYATVPLIQKIKVKEMSDIKFCYFLLGLVVSVQLICTTIKILIGVDKFFSAAVLMRFYIPYFLIRKYNFHSKSLKKFMSFLSIVAVLGYIIVLISKYMHYINLGASVEELIFVYTQTITGIVIFYYLYRALMKFNIPIKVTRISDKYSFYVYLVHCYFIGYSISVLDKFDNLLVGITISLLLTIIFAVILEYISKRLIKCLDNRLNNSY